MPRALATFVRLDRDLAHTDALSSLPDPQASQGATRAGRFTRGMTNSARNVAGDRMVLADLAGRVLCTDAVEHRLRCDATASAIS